jgi:2-succinyl-5-enolpyruvyl-6-hydroxy-3-cyclohexene-1-carboxylate synthase
MLELLLLMVMQTNCNIILAAHNGGRIEVPIEKQVLIFLYKVGHNDQFRIVAQNFDVSESTAHGIVDRMVQICVEHLMPKFITWPGI